MIIRSLSLAGTFSYTLPWRKRN